MILFRRLGEGRMHDAASIGQHRRLDQVIVVGALLAVGISASGIATGFGFVALMLVSVNIFGGFLVTQRMLAMYKKKDK